MTRPARETRVRRPLGTAKVRAIHIFVWVLPLLWAPPATPQTTADLSIERIFGGHRLLRPLPTGMVWQGNSKGVSYNGMAGDGEAPGPALILREVPSGKERVLCLTDTVTVPDDLKATDDTFRIPRYTWDHKGKLVLFTFAGDVFTLEAKTGRIDRRTKSDGDEKDPTFSPDGKWIAYSRDHDLYTLDVETGTEIQLTTTGSDSVLNGMLDWTYMEELFTRGNVKAFWWSPDSRRLAFLEIQEYPVPHFPLVDWIPIHGTYRLQHYPKAGDPIPIVRVGMVDAEGGSVVWADTDTGDDSYIARIYWLGDSRGIAIEKLNRAQDDLVLMVADGQTGATEDVLRETSPTWVNINYHKHYYRKKRQFVWGSERDGHSHLYLFNLDGTLERRLTEGQWEVLKFSGVDESGGKIYFTANEKDVRESHLYSVSYNGGDYTRITREEGIHKVTMSPDRKYFIDKHSSHKTPPRVTVHDVKGKELFEIGDQMTEELAVIDFPVPEFLNIKANGFEFYCMITKPPDFDASRKYPVIVYTYGGPHSQEVRKEWFRHSLWHSMMAQNGYIIFTLDNRGGHGRGKAWEEHILKDMGRRELEDQLSGVDYLKSLPYVDGDRIGIWGWSYGGYMTLMGMFKAADVFRAGVAVSPVTDWRLYDAIYTERYMRHPDDNVAGYESSSTLNFTDGLEGKLLVMHGDADDNVHVQNTVKLVKELVKSGKDFDLMIYPQKFHGISGSKEQTHLYRKMTRFFDEHLKGE